MDDVPVFERLRSAREARGEDRASLARRIGVGERLLRAIDEGRPGDLPSGLYARAAVRRYAQAMALDPEAILAACAARLPAVEDPVMALARLQGLRPAAPARPPGAPAPSSPPVELAAVPRPPGLLPRPRRPQPRPTRPLARPPLSGARPTPGDSVPGCGETGSAPFPAWRPLAAVGVDGLVSAALLLLTIAATVPLSGAMPSAFGRQAALVFGLLGLVLAACYFLFFGGVACATAGERLIGMRVGRRHPRHMNPRMVAVRASRCWARDVRYLRRLGEWAAAEIWSGTAAASQQAGTLGGAAGP